MATKKRSSRKSNKVRYAAVGLGWITQGYFLPGVRQTDNAEVTALVSDSPEKLKALGDQYQIEGRYSYDEYEACLKSGNVDAVYIGLPNSLHVDYTVRAADAGIHILCEKPMADTVDECQKMIDAAARNKVKLMIAYRLHFEEANLRAVTLAKSGKLGDLRVFSSLNLEQVEAGNVRLDKDLGGSALSDVGVYCINAARYIFGAEPVEVEAVDASRPGDPRFGEVAEMTSVVMRFPDERLAMFTCSFGAARASTYTVVGTEGSLRLDAAFGLNDAKTHHIQTGEKERDVKYGKSDHLGAVAQYFAECIRKNRQPAPNGQEGLADVRILEAIQRSAKDKKPVALDAFTGGKRPALSQMITLRPARPPKLVNAKPIGGTK